MRAGQASLADVQEPQRGAEQDSRLHSGSHAFLVAADVQEAKEKKQKAAGLIT